MHWLQPTLGRLRRSKQLTATRAASLNESHSELKFAGTFGALPKSTPIVRGAFGALSDAIWAPTAPKSLNQCVTVSQKTVKICGFLHSYTLGVLANNQHEIFSTKIQLFSTNLQLFGTWYSTNHQYLVHFFNIWYTSSIMVYSLRTKNNSTCTEIMNTFSTCTIFWPEI